jgi:hypothetical protein
MSGYFTLVDILSSYRLAGHLLRFGFKNEEEVQPQNQQVHQYDSAIQIFRRYHQCILSSMETEKPSTPVLPKSARLCRKNNKTIATATVLLYHGTNPLVKFLIGFSNVNDSSEYKRHKH